MRMSNRYKPRYKICYQSKNKVWINKNCKIGRYYNLRAVHSNKTSRRPKPITNMKWIIVKRFFAPRRRHRIHGHYLYKDTFQRKQQFKCFYGNLKERRLRRLLLALWKKQKISQQDLFMGVLEGRLDVILYRLKVFPTIFACGQFIRHQGILINGIVAKNINHPLQAGDIITFQRKHWFLIYRRLRKKLRSRLIFHRVRRHCDYKILKKTKKTRHKLNMVNLVHESRKLLLNLMLLRTYLLGHVFFQELLFPKGIDWLMRLITNQRLLEKFVVNFSNWGPYADTAVNRAWAKEVASALVDLKRKSFTFIFFLKSLHAETLRAGGSVSWNFGNVPGEIARRRSYHLMKMVNRFVAATVPKIAGVYLPNFYISPSWYVPNYLEVDYNTLQISIIGNPNHGEVYYPFYISTVELMAFYRSRGL